MLLCRPDVDDEFFEHLTKADLKHLLAQVLIVFRIAFRAVGLPRISNIDSINDVASFIKSKAGVATHVFLSSLQGTASRASDNITGTSVISPHLDRRTS